MPKLPEIKYLDEIKKYIKTEFGGINHNAGAQTGEIYESQNLTSNEYPLLVQRPKRYSAGTVEGATFFSARDYNIWVSGTSLYYNGVSVMTVSENVKSIAFIGTYILIFPDKLYYNTSDESHGSLEETVVCSAGTVEFQYAASGDIWNTMDCLYASGSNFSQFNDGDAVTVSGCTTHTDNNKTAIIRKVSTSDTRRILFDEGTFVLGTEAGTVTVKRVVPDMDYVCENNNRIWGCKENTIYASKLGDPFNWNAFDGLSTDSYAVSVGSAGEFTACCSYAGYPMFFKPDNIYKVYGTRPSAYQLMNTQTLGADAGSYLSFAVVKETLFYLSRAGIVAYNGGVPQIISQPLGDVKFQNAVGGSDDTKYYVSMKETSSSTYYLYVYDTQRGIWNKEDAIQAVGFGRPSKDTSGNMYMLDAVTGDILTYGTGYAGQGLAEETSAAWSVQFADFITGDPNKKCVSKIQLRVELGESSSMNVGLQYDSSGTWTTIYSITTEAKQSYYIPIIPRRADHFSLKLTGTGSFKLYSLAVEYYSGSEV